MPAPEEAAALERVLDLLRARERLDLAGYRRATVERRVRNRMITAGAPTLAAYAAWLERDREESSRLVERITIKVSRFFRSAPAFEVLARELAADLARAPRRLAVWSAGCGRGEEAYSLAMVLAELGQGGDGPPQVVGTDVDPAALAAACVATYPEAAIAEVPAALRARHLEDRGGRAGGAVGPTAAVRGRVAFLRHDLARAERPPGGARFDLVACRNTLIYFDAALQARALGLLVRALAPGGLLFLGEAEWPAPELARRLRPIDRAARLFRLAAGDRP